MATPYWEHRAAYDELAEEKQQAIANQAAAFGAFPQGEDEDETA